MKYIKKLALAGIVGYGIYLQQNKFIKKTVYNIEDKKIPRGFNNYKIAQVSDIHCDKIGISDMLFYEKLKTENVDIIVITGDILDSYRNNSEVAHNILAALSEIAPCYFVSGNHELRLTNEYAELRVVLDKLRIIDLSNKSVTLEKNNDKIILNGIEDFNYFIYNDKNNYYANHKKVLDSLYQKENYNILLAHRPEKFFIYSEIGFNLVFSGHAHGGQWNIPFVGRVFSPSQGFLPKYTNGVYKEKNTSMIVSQGLGNSSFPLRINNRLELVIVNLLNIQ